MFKIVLLLICINGIFCAPSSLSSSENLQQEISSNENLNRVNRQIATQQVVITQDSDTEDNSRADLQNLLVRLQLLSSLLRIKPAFYHGKQGASQYESSQGEFMIKIPMSSLNPYCYAQHFLQNPELIVLFNNVIKLCGGDPTLLLMVLQQHALTQASGGGNGGGLLGGLGGILGGYGSQGGLLGGLSGLLGVGPLQGDGGLLGGLGNILGGPGGLLGGLGGLLGVGGPYGLANAGLLGGLGEILGGRGALLGGLGGLLGVPIKSNPELVGSSGGGGLLGGKGSGLLGGLGGLLGGDGLVGGVVGNVGGGLLGGKGGGLLGGNGGLVGSLLGGKKSTGGLLNGLLSGNSNTGSGGILSNNNVLGGDNLVGGLTQGITGGILNGVVDGAVSGVVDGTVGGVMNNVEDTIQGLPVIGSVLARRHASNEEFNEKENESSIVDNNTSINVDSFEVEAPQQTSRPEFADKTSKQRLATNMLIPTATNELIENKPNQAPAPIQSQYVENETSNVNDNAQLLGKLLQLYQTIKNESNYESYTEPCHPKPDKQSSKLSTNCQQYCDCLSNFKKFSDKQKPKRKYRRRKYKIVETINRDFDAPETQIPTSTTDQCEHIVKDAADVNNFHRSFYNTMRTVPVDNVPSQSDFFVNEEY